MKQKLKKLAVVNCVTCRLRNVLQAAFYQAETNKTKEDVALSHHFID